MKGSASNKKTAPPLLLTNIRQLLTLRAPGKAAGPRRGPELNDVGIVEDAAVLTAEGKVVTAGKQREVLRHPAMREHKKKLEEFDCTGRVVLPGFVDSHTHPVFVSPRLVDFEKRIAGATYEEIAASGGGIRSSVDAVRKASQNELALRVVLALKQMAAQGTTTVEAKSGYGLNSASELKSLEAIRKAAGNWPGTVVPTLLGAHVVPRESAKAPQSYVREVCRKMIPQVAKRKLASFVDVFCDRGAFSVEDAELVFEAAVKHGLGVRAHVCQLTPSTLWPLLRFNPASFDHMDHVLEEDIPQLAKRNTVATLVPGANYFLGLESFPPARRLIESGVAVAVATDYNPGTSPTASMPFVLSLACTQMNMSPAEAIAAATVNGAHALRVADRKGSIEVGKDADLAVFNAADYREIPYWIAANSCAATVMNGELFSN
ncbi:MAG: imidazolonepropionase [Acidobacteriales bacterium]|nr:imidazolonepropionase [Terriglobales bacterium]